MSHNRLRHSCLVAASLTVLLSVLFVSGGLGRTLAQDDSKSKRITYRSTARPDLVTDYDKVARFKLATRKKEYRVGESVALAYAMLNASENPVFFLRPRFPDFFLKVGAGQEQRLPVFLFVHLSTLPDSFDLLEPGSFVSGSTLLIAGCPRGNEAPKHIENKNASDEIDDRTIFEQGSFGNLEEGCIPFSAPGNYTITAEFGNATVLEDPQHLGAKTAVGRIRSEPLTISIR